MRGAEHHLNMQRKLPAETHRVPEMPPDNRQRYADRGGISPEWRGRGDLIRHRVVGAEQTRLARAGGTRWDNHLHSG